MKYISLLIILFVCFAAHVIAQEKTRTISKEETANKDVELAISTNHGNLEVIEWNKELVRLEATIVVEGKSIEDSEKALEYFNVTLEGNNSWLKVEEQAKKPRNSMNMNLKKRTVTYKIYAPKGAGLKISHNFGDIMVGNFSRGVNIELSHGDLSAQELQEGTKLSLNFGKAYLGKVHKANFALNHYKMFLNSAEGLKADLNFSEMELKELSRDLKASANHSTIEVQKISSASSPNISITANFSDIELDFAKGSAVELNLNSNRGNQKFRSSSKKVVSESKSYQNKQMQVILGPEKSASTKVMVTQNFGNLTIDVAD